MTIADPIAFVVFILLWLAYARTTDSLRFRNRVSLTRAMNAQRAAWIRNAMRRDLRMIDTQIMAGLQNGTAFFASTSILALGGCFALLGATEKVFMIFGDLPLVFQAGRAGFELKVGGWPASSAMPSSNSAGPTGCSTIAPSFSAPCRWRATSTRTRRRPTSPQTR